MSSKQNHVCFKDIRVGSAGSQLMSNTMTVLCLLPGFLVLLALCNQLVGASRSEEIEDLSSHLRRLWLLHMREALLKGEQTYVPLPLREQGLISQRDKSLFLHIYLSYQCYFIEGMLFI